MIDQDTLEKRIQELGKTISEEYAGKEILLVCILKGGAMFMTQLAKYITVPVTMDFMILSSYGNDLISTGTVSIKKDMDEDIEGKHVLVVEDIVDTGRTLWFLRELLKERKAASVKICTMLDKPARRVVPVEVEYTGFEIEDEFVVGYGLDYEQHYRNLPYIGYVEV
ncbi:MAG: hypoxanthine phosphoribosyltransferase [Lachnospiraceae bacterium]|nr:hypoxanthine phosphoribosyltransferase [Lachnospiraceae bacterium]